MHRKCEFPATTLILVWVDASGNQAIDDVRLHPSLSLQTLPIRKPMQTLKWYCSMRYWRQAVAALTIYCAMFAIWNIAVR